MTALGLHHALVAAPAGSEDVLREFYTGVVGLPEIPKPPLLAERGGVWLRVGEHELHCGIEADSRPARKAHPCLVVDDLDALADGVLARGGQVGWAEEIPGGRRFHTSDPVGNRIEFQAVRD